MILYSAQKCRWTPKIGSWGPVYCHCRLAGTSSKGRRNLGGVRGACTPLQILAYPLTLYQPGGRGQIVTHICITPLIFRPSDGPNILSPHPTPVSQNKFFRSSRWNHFIHIISSIESSTKFTPVLT